MLKDAMRAAGLKTSTQRLVELAQDAWRRHPANSEAAARRTFVQDVLCRDLTFTLFIEFDRNAIGQAIGWLLNSNRSKVEVAKATGGGQISSDTHGSIAPANPSPDGGMPKASRRSEPANPAPSPSVVAPAAPNLTALSDRMAARAAVSAQVQLRLCRLDTVLINGKPIGDCTVAETKAWASIRQQDSRHAARDARFALSLVANLPAAAVIRAHWTNPDEVDTIYAKAEAEYAA